MPRFYKQVVGYFGFLPPSDVVCDGDACLISGSETTLRNYLKIAKQSHSNRVIIKETSFGEVMRGLSLGAAYSFDQEAYATFYPMARIASLDVPEGNFKVNPGKDIEFMTIRLKRHA